MENKSDTTREFTLRFLQDITNNFSQEHIIGSGGYGVVYRGVLENGEEIAIKKLHYMPGLDDTQFRNEFNNLIRVQHRNITRLVGYCYHLGHELIMYNGEYVFAHVEERALCFEYLQNGSLDKYISDESGGLDWRARYKIIKGVCKGLNYLHNGYKDPIYHLDLKPANILLDKDMTPKIGDFGLSRLFPSAHTYTTIKIIGTPGYMPPEYIEKYEITSKFDVFSLGVIIIRIIAGDEGYSKRANMSSQEFVKDVHENWQKRMGEITTSRTSLEVRTCIEIALRCVEADRMRRPTISEIFIELNEIDTVDSSPISQGAEDMEDDSGFEYSDDEPIVAPPCSETRVQLMIKKYSNEVPLHENRKKVMLQLTRGASVGRLGLDMVIVLDISGSMQGKKIQEMKTTTKFIINKLSHIDRLSIVTFSVVAARLCPLRLITESSQFELQGLIDSLTASGDTANIIDGLQIGLKVLADRKVSRGRVVAVMIMSDGLQISRGSQVDIDCNNVPVYTFGFGDRDPMVLHEVADKSNGGTFSAMIQDMDGLSFAFSRCLDSLLTIVVQDLRLTVQSVKEEFIILIKVITDGSHTQAQDAHHGSVTVSLGDLSIRDVHNVTVDLDLPATKSECSTDILKITYSYSTFGELFVAPPFTMTVWRTSIPPYSYKYPDRPPIMAWPAGDKYAVLIKLLLVGDSGVGKSTLLLQFTDGSFSPSFISTISFNFKIRTIELDNRQVELQVWDTAGQECFQTITTDRVQTITTGFYRTGILFVYDVTNESSFNNVRVWYRKIKEHSPYVNKILVGNRSDMDESKRAVTTSRGQALADEYGIRFFETSAKTYLNVEEVFLSLARDVIHRYNYWS